MNTFKTTASLVAAAFPAAFAAQSLGVPLPAFFSIAHLMGAFVVAMTLLVLTTDYRARKPLKAYRRATANVSVRSRYRLAA